MQAIAFSKLVKPAFQTDRLIGGCLCHCLLGICESQAELLGAQHHWKCHFV